MPDVGFVPGYGSGPWVWVRSLGVGPVPRYDAMCWSSVKFSAKLGKIVSQSLPLIVKLSLVCPRLPEKLLDQVEDVGGRGRSRVLQSQVLQVPHNRVRALTVTTRRQ